MFSKYFKQKIKDVGSFLRIFKGKRTRSEQLRAKEVSQEIRSRYRPSQKILRTEVDRDISAI